MTSFRDQLHPKWRELLKDSLGLLDRIEEELRGTSYLPKRDDVLKSLGQDPSLSRVLILGQDPYPNEIDAMGLAFSTARDDDKLPASLKNIFTELASDLSIAYPKTGDLSPWRNQGVILLNRSLTCRVRESDSHRDIGWREFTDQVVRVLADIGVVAILWGKSAQEVSGLFPMQDRIESVHPSPLSAYRGFFGSKPFSRSNAALIAKGKSPVEWKL
jgi:uracil-DNA glycosylase